MDDIRIAIKADAEGKYECLQYLIDGTWVDVPKVEVEPDADYGDPIINELANHLKTTNNSRP